MNDFKEAREGGVFFKRVKRMKRGIDGFLSSLRIDPIRPNPPSPLGKTSIEEPLEKSVEEYAEAHAALKLRQRKKRMERMRSFIEALE